MILTIFNHAWTNHGSTNLSLVGRCWHWWSFALSVVFLEAELRAECAQLKSEAAQWAENSEMCCQAEGGMDPVRAAVYNQYQHVLVSNIINSHWQPLLTLIL